MFPIQELSKAFSSLYNGLTVQICHQKDKKKLLTLHMEHGPSGDGGRNAVAGHAKERPCRGTLNVDQGKSAVPPLQHWKNKVFFLPLQYWEERVLLFSI